MKLIKRLSCALWSVVIVHNAHAMVFDNRFVPLIAQPFFANKDAYWDYGVRAVFYGAKHTINPDIMSQEGDEIPLYDLFGRYDQLVLDAALQKAQITTAPLIRPDLLSTVHEIPWRQNGKLSFQGLVFETFVHLTHYLGIGGSFIGGKMDTQLELVRTGKLLQPADEQELLEVNANMHRLLGLNPPCFDKGLFGDIDLYVRLHAVREYWNKFRRIDLGCNFGFLIPTSYKNVLDNPASILLRNPHFGLYGSFEGTFVLREDITVGLLLRGSKRFSHTSCSRMPVLLTPTTGEAPVTDPLLLVHEPINYGTLVGNLNVNPGWTVIFSPRVQLSGLREGLGINIAYFLTAHFSDRIQDRRTNAAIAASAQANTCFMEQISSWGSDYVSVAALYDFGYDKEHARFAPILSLIVDIPFKGLVSKRVVKTHGISLRIESRI